MENPRLPQAIPEFSQEPPPECTNQLPTDSTPTVVMDQATHCSTYEAGELVESPVLKIRKRICVTTISALMAIVWTIFAMYFTGVSTYWWLASLPAAHLYESLVAFVYPMGAVFLLVLLLSPVFAVAGDVRKGNWSMLKWAILLNVIGLILAVVLYVAYLTLGTVIILLLALLACVLMLVAGGLFQTNIIQFGRDVLGDANSSEAEHSAFVHWYYWATYVPIFSIALYYDTFQLDFLVIFNFVLILLILVANALLVILLVTCILHCRRMKVNQPRPRVTENPVTLVYRVTRFAVRVPASPGHRGFLARLNNTRQSKGGPAKDDDADSVFAFWLVVLLMASMYGFFFWDDMWAMPLANGLINSESSMAALILSSQATTSIIVVICVPLYQFVVRPFLGERSPPHLWRIFLGLAFQLISLIIALVTGAITTSKFGSEEVSNTCSYNVTSDVVQNDENTGEGLGWYILVIPQAANGIGQLLVFPAVMELILIDIPRVMQGLLIGIWYAMYSIHVIVGLVETATCAVFYWQYYIVKIVLVLVSVITFSIMSSFYKRNHPVRNRQGTLTHGDAPYELLHETKDADRL